MSILLHVPIPDNSCIGCRINYSGPVPTFGYEVEPGDACEVLNSVARGSLLAFFVKRLGEQPIRPEFKPKALAFAMLLRFIGFPKTDASAEFCAAADQLGLRIEDLPIAAILEYVYAEDCPEMLDLRGLPLEIKISGSNSHFDFRVTEELGECGEGAESIETDRSLK